MTIGVLVMAHGTPATHAEIAPFYTRIRHGRPPTPEQLADLESRYDAIGGTSPLTEVTQRQVSGVARALVELGVDATVEYGAKHVTPFVEDGAARLRHAGVDEVVGIVLAPHASSLSTGEYHERATSALAPVEYHAIGAWWDNGDFLDVVADRVRDATSRIPADRRATTEVIFSAHSLPTRVVTEGEDYPEQLRASAAATATRAGVDRWSVAWQSAGRTADPWLGPDIRDALRRASADGVTDVVSCPIGFVADHLEVLFDLDIEAAAVAREIALGYSRTSSLNDDPRFTTALARMIRAAA